MNLRRRLRAAADRVAAAPDAEYVLTMLPRRPILDSDTSEGQIDDDHLFAHFQRLAIPCPVCR